MNKYRKSDRNRTFFYHYANRRIEEKSNETDQEKWKGNREKIKEEEKVDGPSYSLLKIYE